MKVRKGFVSNSSSSSFIVEDSKNIPDLVQYHQLNKKQIEVLKNSDDKFKNLGDEVYLTQFISDCYNDPKHAIELNFGNHSEPYDEEDYIELSNSVWFPKKLALKTGDMKVAIGYGYEDEETGYYLYDEISGRILFSHDDIDEGFLEILKGLINV